MNKPNINKAWWSTIALFLLHGLVVSTWISRIPAIKLGLGLTDRTFGLTLLSSAIGAVLFIPAAGALVVRYGSKKVAVGSGVVFSLGLIPLAWATNVWLLAAALFLYGAMAGAMGVGMNAQGVEVEHGMGKPTMSRFHAMFSLGGMVGSSIGGMAAAHGISPHAHFAVGAAFNAIALLAIFPFLMDSHDSQVDEHRLPLSKTPTVLLALSAIGFCIFLSEGAMADWTAIYLRQNLLAGEGVAAAGYAVFSAAMAIFRLIGDWITARLGAMQTVRTGSLLGAVGVAWALLGSHAGFAMPGFAIAGMGFSVIIPLVFGTAGRVQGIKSGAAIATVSGMGYIGFIVGPPIIGFVSDLLSLRLALCIVVGCCIAAATLSGHVRTGGENATGVR